MTKAELFEVIDYNTVTMSHNRAIKTAVEKCLSASNDGKPLVSGSLPLAELGSFVDWIREMNFKQYADGWCEAGGSNGWHCTTDELLKMYRDRRQ